MPLSPKAIHKLRNYLSLLIDDADAAKACCTRALLNNIGKIYFTGSAWEMWGDILDHTKNEDAELTKLLNQLCKEYPGDATIEYYLNELSTNQGIRIKKIAAAIHNQSCVLFMGPEVLRIDDNKGGFISFNQHLCEKIQAALDTYNIYYDASLQANLSYMAQCYTEVPKYVPGDVARMAKDEYTKAEKNRLIDTRIYDSLSTLPFKLIINTNPDDLLYTCLNASRPGICINSYYDTSNMEELNEIEAEQTLQKDFVLHYNIFGTFNQPNSILYTEGQFLDITNRLIQGNPKINPAILDILNTNDSYLFLGFDFDQWYFKILFELFKLKKERYRTLSCNNDLAGISTLNREFFEEEFKIFFEKKGILQFINSLKEHA
jgi:hypothetical protein